MGVKNKYFLSCLIFLFLITLIPSKTAALLPNSFDQSVNDYFFLKYTVVNNLTSAVTGFPIPPAETNWMIEVDSIDNSTSWDIINGLVYQETSDYLNFWEPTTLFGPGSFEFGRYNGTSFQIGSTFESLFPVPFIVPVDMVTVFNYTLNESLSAHFEHYSYMNGTAIMESMGEMASMLPFGLFGIVIAYNGSNMWLDRSSRQDPYGNQTGNIMLLAIYFDDGELNFLRESWWDNETDAGDGYGVWRTMYKVGSPIWNTFGAPMEAMLPGGEGEMGMIPGFPCTFTIIGFLVSITIIYLKKPKRRLIL